MQEQWENNKITMNFHCYLRFQNLQYIDYEYFEKIAHC